MRFLSAALLLMIIPQAVYAGNWPGWRGPNGNGVAESGSYPAEWSTKDIVWDVELPGLGASTPAVYDDAIFVTSTKDGKNVTTCIGMDGSQRWSNELGESIDGKHRDATGANPSPVVDGERVFVYFKSGDFACYGFDGELKWEINIFESFAEVTTETLWWDLGTSPVLTENAVVVTMMHSGPSYLAAFDRKSGDLLWKHDRMTDAPKEAAQSYTTPIVTKNPAGKEVIVVTGADYVTCHDSQDGSELWRVGTLNPEANGYFRSISSSVAGDGVVIAPYARGGTLTAIKFGGSGDVTGSHVMWTKKDTSADVPTPTIANGRVYVVRDSKQFNGTVDCLDLQSGKTIWSGKLQGRGGSKFRSSPIVADGKLYATRQDGTVYAVDAMADEFTVLGESNVANDLTVATPVFVNGAVLLRTQSRLYRLGS